jgi:hypothetical protein
MKFKAYGHANVTGTHKTTFEITKDTRLSEKGTCIIAVKADFDPDALRDLVKNSDRVKIKLIADGIVDEIKGDVNKEFDDDTEIVIRMGEYLDKRTLVRHADKSAKYLKKELIEKLKNPEQELEIEIEKTTK